MGEEAIFFETPNELRAWLEQHHATASELWVGFYKKASGRGSLTWSDVVDEALCFGWIDGKAQGIDEQRYRQRLTPRRRNSNWSAVNVARVAELTREGRMQPTGLAAFEKRAPERTGIYAYEQRHQARLDPEMERQFQANDAAWSFFQAQAPFYRRTITFWVVSAKKEETRQARLASLIAASAEGRRLR